jgi:hypothetical protein
MVKMSKRVPSWAKVSKLIGTLNQTISHSVNFKPMLFLL